MENEELRVSSRHPFDNDLRMSGVLEAPPVAVGLSFSLLLKIGPHAFSVIFW